MSAAWYESGTLVKYARRMVAHGVSCLMSWLNRDTVIMRHGFTATRSSDNLGNGKMVTLWHRLGFTATRSTNDLFALKYGDIVMGRPRDTVT